MDRHEKVLDVLRRVVGEVSLSPSELVGIALGILAAVPPDQAPALDAVAVVREAHAWRERAIGRLTASGDLGEA